MSAYIYGWHGRLNFGDDIFTEVLRWGLKRYADVDQLVFESDPYRTLGLATGTQVVAPNTAVPGLTRLRRWHLRRSQTHFVLGGGSTLRDSKHLAADGGGFFHHAIQRVGIGISVGPFEDGPAEARVAEFLRRFDYLGFRDTRSFEWAKNKNLEADAEMVDGFDMAVLAAKVGLIQQRHSTRGQVGVSLLSPTQLSKVESVNDGTTVLSQISEVLASCYQDKKFLALNLCSNPQFPDQPATDIFLSKIQAHQVHTHTHCGNVTETLSAMSGCQTIVSMRLHGCIMALALGIPFVVLAYHQKCEDFATMIGLDPRLVIPIREFDRRRLEDAIALTQSSDCPRNSVPFEKLEARALANFEGLKPLS